MSSRRLGQWNLFMPWRCIHLTFTLCPFASMMTPGYAGAVQNTYLPFTQTWNVSVFHLAGCQTDSLVDSHSAFYGSYCRYRSLWFNIPLWDEEQLDRCVQAFQLVIQALGIRNVSSMGYNPVCWPLEGPTRTRWCVILCQPFSWLASKKFHVISLKPYL